MEATSEPWAEGPNTPCPTISPAPTAQDPPTQNPEATVDAIEPETKAGLAFRAGDAALVTWSGAQIAGAGNAESYHVARA
eukprot:9312771-Lingulodinium_polyedra.AAC.1